LVAEIIDEYGDELEKITLVRGKGGQFVVTVDGTEVFSKKTVGRHAEPGEVVANMKQLQGNGQSEGTEHWRPAGK
jgi:selenoprotein W-related protein